MVRLRLLPFAAVVTAAIACGNVVDTLRLDPTPRPQTQRHTIRLLAQEPREAYMVIAIVAARGEVEFARGELIKEAARLGGNAILLEAGSLTRVPAGESGSEPQLTGKVIVFIDSTKPN